MARKKIGYTELQWTCPNCKGINPGSSQTCQSCGAPQPENVQFEQAVRQELIKDDKEIEARIASGADIHCPYCGTRNPATNKVCLQCGGDISEGARRQAGSVVGAFQSGPPGTRICPRCGSENPDTAKSCQNCGASMETQAEPQSSVTAPIAQKNTMLPVVLIVAVVVIFGAVILMLVLSNRTQEAQGIVQSVTWQRSIPIEALVPVQYQDWQDQIPINAQVEVCREELRIVEEEPIPGSIEVCGTPYNVDTGSGYAEVVQDCVYEVYDALCSYTIDEWRTVNIATLRGNDLSAVWPDPVLEDGQRTGQDFDENYTIIFISDGDSYTYTTSDYNLFQQAQIGSEWNLNINSFGKITDIEP